MDEKMARTQVYLPRDIYDQLRDRADAEGLTMAHQIREALAQYIVDTVAEDQAKYAIADDDPLWDLIGIVGEGGVADDRLSRQMVVGIDALIQQQVKR